MHSVNGGWHGLAGWCFRRLPETSAGVWADDGGNSLSDAGSSLVAANLCLEELRSVPEISGAARLPEFLAGKAGGAASFGPRRALQADQARGAARGGRRVPVALRRWSISSSSQRTPGPIRRVGYIERRCSTAFAPQGRSVVMDPGSRSLSLACPGRRAPIALRLC